MGQGKVRHEMAAPKPFIRLKVIERVREPIAEEILVRSKVKKWAYHNAHTLIFLSVMFVITWVVAVVTSTWN
jgi:hypothetical protein